MESVLTMDDVHNHLKPIIIQRRKFQQAERTAYRVYSAPGEYELVEAETANEAFERSGIKRPHKIEREMLHSQSTLKPGAMMAAPEEESISFNPALPDPEDLKPVLYALLSEELANKPQVVFESIMIGDLKKLSEREKLAALPEPEPEPEVMAELEAPLQPVIEEAPEAPPPPPEKALTPEEVDALLKG